jgi:pilus assembly protein Flp/PilA
MNLLKRFIREQEGQDGVEYALLVAFCSLAIVTGATTLGTDVSTFFSNVGGAVAAVKIPGA